MIKLLIFSFKKSKLLSKIATESNQKHFDANDILNQAIQNITRGKTLNKRELYIEQLLTLLAKDIHTTNLLAEYGKTFDDVRKIISQLELFGAGQIVKGHYVAVSSIAFIKQLQFILQHWNGENFMIENLDSKNSNMKVVYILIRSFE